MNKYQEFANTHSSDRDTTFKETLNLFNNQAISILEIGCARGLDIESNNKSKDGDGWSTLFWTNYIKQNGGRLIICDINVSALRNCKELLGDLAKEIDVSFYLGDGLNFITGEFDLIYIDGSDSPVEALAQFEKVDQNKTVVLIDDLHVKGTLITQKYPQVGVIEVNKAHRMGLFNPKNTVISSPKENYCNDVNITNKVEFNEINKERLLVVVPHGANRNPEILEWHKKVMNFFQIRTNYIYFPFKENHMSHGAAFDQIIKATKDHTDYWVFLDNDCVPMQSNFLNYIYQKIIDKDTLFGPIGNSNHLKGTNGNIDNPYIYGSGMCISKILWEKLGSPSFNEDNINFDTAERITYLTQKFGYNICALWPKSVEGMTFEECDLLGVDRKHAKSAVGNFHFGFGTTYGNNVLYHQMCAHSPRHVSSFIAKCKEIING